MPEYEVVSLGCLGGALPDILRIVKLRYEPAPAYLKRAFFWASLFLLLSLGGGTAYLVHPDKVIEALSIGYSAPGILSKLLSNEEPPGRIGTKKLLQDAGPVRDYLAMIPWEIPNFFAPLQKWWAKG